VIDWLGSLESLEVPPSAEDFKQKHDDLYEALEKLKKSAAKSADAASCAIFTPAASASASADSIATAAVHREWQAELRRDAAETRAAASSTATANAATSGAAAASSAAAATQVVYV
jgi:hypothetical protein